MIRTYIIFILFLLIIPAIKAQENTNWILVTHPGTGLSLEYPVLWWDQNDTLSSDTSIILTRSITKEGAWGKEEKIIKASFIAKRYPIEMTWRAIDLANARLSELESETSQNEFLVEEFPLEIDGDKAVAIHTGAEGENYKGYLFHGFYRPVRIYLVREGYGYEFIVFADDSMPKEEFLPVFERMMQSVKMPWN